MTLPPFQRLVDEHWRAVARLAHALAGPSDGDDVAQQAWTQALAAYPRLRSDRNLRGWLLTITARCAIDVHRNCRTVPVAHPPEDARPAGAAAGAGAGPGPDGEDQIVGEPLWRAVRELPERQRTALALRYLCDLDHASVARFLDTTPGASRRLVSDALTAVRGRLDRDPTLRPATAEEAL